MESKNNSDVLKNFGISQDIFNLDKENNNQSDVYIIKQDKIKKNFSEGAICKIPGSYMKLAITKAKDDMELYGECDQEYAVFGGAFGQREKMDCEANLHSNANTSFSTLFDNYNDFNLNNNFSLNGKKTNAIMKNFSNFSTCSNFSNNFGSLKIEENECKGAKCSKSLCHQTFFANENCEYKLNNFHCKKIDSIENPNYEINQNINYQNNNNSNNKLSLKKIVKKETNQDDIYKNVLSKTVNTADNYNENNLPANSEEELKNGIFKNSVQNQMDQLNRIFQEMNESSEAKVIIKAYKSKLKTKFYKIYESNSEFYKEKNKYKIFHKCNFPGCSRTFASAGWLKSHFNEHLQELKCNKFNVEFEKSLIKLKHMNLLK